MPTKLGRCTFRFLGQRGRSKLQSFRSALPTNEFAFQNGWGVSLRVGVALAPRGVRHRAAALRPLLRRLGGDGQGVQPQAERLLLKKAKSGATLRRGRGGGGVTRTLGKCLAKSCKKNKKYSLPKLKQKKGKKCVYFCPMKACGP